MPTPPKPACRGAAVALGLLPALPAAARTAVTTAGLGDALLGLVWWIVHFLFFTLWGWILLFALASRLLQGPLSTWQRRRRFADARRMELQNPKDAGARFQLGLIHYNGRQWRRAIRWFTEAVRAAEVHGAEVDPKLYQYLGHALRHRRDHARAIAAYEAGLDEAPGSGRGESETGLGISHLALGQLEAGEAWLRRARERNDSLIEPRLRLAALLHRTGRAEESREVAEEAARIDLPPFLARQQRRWRVMRALWPLSRPLA